MQFSYVPYMRRGFPGLVSAAFIFEGVTPTVDVSAPVAQFHEKAAARLASGTESDLASIQAWRRAFSSMGLKPTQYRCAAEALLRRFRKEQALPELHPLIDVCNAISLACAIPIAVFDLGRIVGDLQVRPAVGDETYETFRGDIEHPEPGEIIFADAAGQAHARRWTNRQSGRSAIRLDTTRALIVAEALHATAASDVASLGEALQTTLSELWPNAVVRRVAVQ
ncbi:MAG: phenylalanine--tRNA ligase beta subunit-related protein [Acidihalobacter sp.]